MNTEMNFRFCYADPVITKAMIPNSLSQWSKVSAICNFYREIRKANTIDPGEQERQVLPETPYHGTQGSDI